MKSVSEADIAATRPECPADPPRVVPREAMRHRVYNVTSQPDLRVLWRRSFRAFEAEAPRSVLPTSNLCEWLSRQQWPYCRDVRTGLESGVRYAGIAEEARAAVATAASTPPPLLQRHNTLMLVSMPCAFTDAGTNFRGALYDSRRVLNAQHRSATPRFAHLSGPVRRYDVAAVGLTPYGHLADAHFYASTAPWVLTLLHVLPASVPVLIASSSKLKVLYDRLGVPPQRLHTLPPGGAVYATQLLSLVTEPFGALEPLGASALRRVRARLVPHPPPRAEERRHVVLLSRNDLAPRRSLRNQPALQTALGALLQHLNTDRARAGGAGRRSYVLDVYQGSQIIQAGVRSRSANGGGGSRDGSTFAMRLSDAAALFSRAALVTGPHGGAFLNLVYCAPNTPIIEIGYTAAQPMAYPSYYHTMARRLGLQFWVVLGSGAYDRPILAPVSEVVSLAAALLG